MPNMWSAKSLSILAFVLAISVFLRLPHFTQSFSFNRILVTKLLYPTLSHLKLEAIRIALTREAGTNEKLSKLLPDLECVELPCIQFFDGEDLQQLKVEMLSSDVIIITSPQSAEVFIQEWTKIGKPKMNIAVVGKGTAAPLIAQNLHIVFQPSDATAETLAKELPMDWGTKILYPTSSIAEKTLQSGLESRGFHVKRLNTYTTGPAVWTNYMMEQAKSVDIVTFASPSAIRTWVERVGCDQCVVAIGPTSKKLALKLGFKNVHSPEEGSKGIEPWAHLIRKIAGNLSVSNE